MTKLKHLSLLLCVFLLGCSQEAKESGSINYAAISSDEAIESILPEITNWNRWGTDDEIGTLNFITPEKVTEASLLIKKGITVSLARQTSINLTNGVREGRYEMQKGAYGSRDFVGAVWHGFAVTHLDGLSHVFADTSRMYNGYPVSNITKEGARKLGIDKLASSGIIGRGILIDAAEYLDGGVTLGQALTPEDLNLILDRQQVKIKSGDILFVRTGLGMKNTRDKRAGLHPSCVVWMYENEVSLLGSDGDNDAHPIPFKRWSSPFHTIGIPYLGLPLIDNADLERLSEICKQEQRYEFFVSINPWRIEGTTSSPINPIAVF
ncbi:cyclase family protein [Ekhidna sp.]|uniref:cyclase family protein n=1 Tax=Ekhidna sp. TaxID=2608089 RepID=UPI0035114C33